MNAPKHAVATASHGAMRCSRTTAGRAGSRSSITTGSLPRASA